MSEWKQLDLYEYVADDGSHNGYGQELLPGAGSFEAATQDDPMGDSAEWTVTSDDEPEETEVSMPLSDFARLLAKAKQFDRHMKTCCPRSHTNDPEEPHFEITDGKRICVCSKPCCDVEVTCTCDECECEIHVT